MSNETPKIRFWDGFFMNCGSIIGAGIFAMTGIGVKACGPAIPLAFLLGGLYAIFNSLPMIVMSSAIPIKGGTYRYTSQFVSPLAGFLVFWNSILGVATLTLMGIAAGKYLPLLLPFLSERMASIIVVLAISTACFFNIQFSAKVQNSMVILMFVALAMFVGMSIPHMKYWKFSDMFHPYGGIGGLLLAVNYVRYAALGGTALVPMASEVENPGFTVPATTLSSTIGVTLVYGFVAATAVGVIPWEQMIDQPLGTAAAAFTPPWALTFFLVGGALFAVSTTFLASMLMTSRTLWAAAEDGLLPSWFSALNKHGIPHNILGLLTIAAVTPIALGASIEYVYAIQMAPSSIFTVLTVAPAILAPLRMPEVFKKAWFKMPNWASATVALINIIVALYFGLQLFKTLDLNTIIGVVVFFGGGVFYYFWWKKRLAAKGIDLESQMGVGALR